MKMLVVVSPSLSIPSELSEYAIQEAGLWHTPLDAMKRIEVPEHLQCKELAETYDVLVAVWNGIPDGMSFITQEFVQLNKQVFLLTIRFDVLGNAK